MQKIVSVIIPCFNAEKWLAEAINSCLEQTYSNIEIIVIDDGSTDNCLEIIRSYGDKVIWQSLPHKGGNYARNRGFDLSKGDYIQYLDADDYILPEKIERQVRFLEETGADVVYGDWRHRRHLLDGSSVMEDIETSEAHADILASLLANWWVALAALLYKRTAVKNSAGWDETLTAAQDRDFFLSVVMNEAKVVYQPGCYSIYRRYGSVTVSTSSKNRWLKSHYLVLEKVEKQLFEMNKLSIKYRHALAKSYFELARESLFVDYSQYLIFLEEALVLFPEFKTNSKRAAYKVVQNILGFRQTERIACRALCVKKLVNSLSDRIVQPKEKFSVTS
ncbi:glycosyltransferase family 2 protein [aff. Roholtiella sp. LEGE 12411]|uniref:glycosyltransferase family 2 protein n=1 Tax=aff. Roholtiella sp. LEGE 12411 TaxID=1828822 RepID=UPI00187F2D37|nr:glycosyltransferase [aff. Roholtiella sp. LEGE 12411]MBE9034929.1 glycosyltransferase [aff. Roholtiella sp. LEGE 12411]